MTDAKDYLEYPSETRCDCMVVPNEEIKKYRRKHSLIQAVQFTGDNVKEIKRFVRKYGGIVRVYKWIYAEKCLSVNHTYGSITIFKDDWLVFLLDNEEFVRCKADYFAEIYEQA